MPTNPPFDDPSAAGRRVVAVLGVAERGATLSKTQKRFNQLVEKLGIQRGELQRWQAFIRVYHLQLREQYEPLVARLREQRIAMARLLDQAVDSGELGRRERDKARYLLNQMVAALLDEGEDPLLVRLHDKYAAVSLEELRQERMELLRAVANETLNIDVGSYAGSESPAEFEDWIEEQVRASRTTPDSGEEPVKRKPGKLGKRASLREQAAEGGTRAVRDAYRKLVSELHPDRETDPDEQRRKTELMQRVNQAYKGGDLLGLLELQLAIEQIDAAALAGLADERLRHYVHVLEEQSRQLRDELAELIEPIAVILGESAPRKLSPDVVQRLLDQDIRRLKATVRKIEMDVICCRDIRQLKQSLDQQHRDPLDDDELSMPDDFRPPPRGVPRRHGRRR